MSAEAASDRRLTLRGALDRATAAFAAAGLPRPRRDATRLLADLLDLSPAEVALGQDRVVEPDRRRWIDRAVTRRAAGEPLAYVTGLVGFRHLTLRADPRALIPRPESEGLVDRALARAGGGVAVDIGTGTGCLALALRDEGAFDRVLAVDWSVDALALASRNARQTGLAIDLVRGDLTAPLAAASVDVLVANPPYLSESEYLALDRDVAAHEPRLALVSGPDGLLATRRLIADAGRVLRPGGLLLVEIAADRPDATAEIARAAGLTAVRIETDLFERPRYLIAQRETT